MDGGAVGDAAPPGSGQVGGGDDQDHVLAVCVHMEMDLAAHHLADVHRAGHGVRSGLGKVEVGGADAGNDPPLVPRQLAREELLALSGELDHSAADVNGDLVAFLYQLGVVKEIHLRGADKAGHKDVGGLFKNLLGGADLLDEAVLHNDDTVAQGHGFGLVVSHIDEGGADLLAKLNELRTHLVAELGVQIGEGLIHQHDLGVADNGPANGHPLALAAGQGLGLSVQILGDAQDLGGLPYLLVDLLLGELTKLQGEGHIFIDRHMGIKSVALEDHGNVPVLGGHVVDQCVVDVQFAPRDLLQAGDHAQGGGFSAARGADKNNELLVLDLQVELLDSHHALLGDLKIDLLFRCILTFFGLFGALLLLAVGIDLFDVFQGQSSHNIRLEWRGLRQRHLARERAGLRGITTGLHTAAPQAAAVIFPPFFSTERYGKME